MIDTIEAKVTRHFLQTAQDHPAWQIRHEDGDVEDLSYASAKPGTSFAPQDEIQRASTRAKTTGALQSANVLCEHVESGRNSL